MKITFELLHEAHYPVLLKWLSTPHVKTWWDSDTNWTHSSIENKYSSYVQGYKIQNNIKKTIHAYIILINNTPVGYIQTYNAYDFPRSDKLTGLPDKLAAIDFYIGDEKQLQQGFGTCALIAFIEKLSHGEFTHVFVDPEKTNVPAIKTYEKAGFITVKNNIVSENIWMLRQMTPGSINNVILSTKNSPHYFWGENCDSWRLKQEGQFSVISEKMPPHTSEKKHFHQFMEQYFYCLAGTLTIETSEKCFELHVGDSMIIPPKVIHTVFNNSDQDTSFLVISSPSSPDDRIEVG